MPPVLVEYPQCSRGPWISNPLARGADGVLRYGNLNPALTELLDVQVHAFSAREAVVEVGGPRLTYRQLWHAAARIAGGLQEHGIGYGDRVAVKMPVGASWVQAFLGALLSGAVPVLVADGLSDAAASRVLADSSADFVLDGGGPEYGYSRFPDGAAFIDDGASLTELALLCYTSAETPAGAPRGVELTNENLLSAVRSMVGALNLPTDGLRNLVLAPLAHASGCVDQVLPTFAVGGTVVLVPDSARIAETLTGGQIDMVSTTPRTVAGLLPQLSEVRAEGVKQVCLASHRSEVGPSEAARSERGPAPTVGAVLRRMFPRAQQWSVWGATETSGIGLACAGDLPDGAVHGRDVLGLPFGGTELALWGPAADSGHGELLCRGPNVSRRYWNDPQTTSSRFTGTWFHTGNEVRIDADGLVHRVA
ncbi:class I adenylate-forming enzyme family protein [Nocardia stercoris]|uniref:Long-chain fatty acid--CoA ligase n=1 Tax=Nocardia stercoris TaxID=2483361 RepID=A0A3M2LJX7_9NOCA|nr:AMP-binding protein [Nocardia stercoris]RMI35068.1 long-chain fatty acid--CoA ligase [Nocardia stercoris]